MVSKSEAMITMNTWGAKQIPFLFIIDFEMKAIRLFRLDFPLPVEVEYKFHGRESPKYTNDKNPHFTFQKYPVSFKEYQEAFKEIQKQILTGNSFLTNLTFPTPIETNLSLREIYKYSHARYKLLIDGIFACFSPESFVRIYEGTISTYPMKGTIRASVPDAEHLILSDPKETAEHNTIVDLLRNDLSMVATDIQIKRFRYIDRVLTHEGDIFQVSSEITGKLPKDFQAKLGDLIFTLLPAGSVTGAPKRRTTEIIQNVEKADRGYYTGICGIFDGKNLDSAVMIRFIELHNGRMRFRSGGGITSLSMADYEYNELIDKVYVPIV